MTRVLVVEDEESFTDPLSYLLRKEGFEVAVAGDRHRRRSTSSTGNGADLVLLDLMLPGLSGTEVCRQLRARSNVPVIMLTAKDSEIDKVVGLELGADDYVTKPYSLARAGRPDPRGAAPRRRAGGAGAADGRGRSGADGRRAARGHASTAQAVPLPLKEFELLEMLLRNAGRVLTRDAAHRPGLGLGLRRRHQDPRRPRQAAAQQDRAGPGAARSTS